MPRRFVFNLPPADLADNDYTYLYSSEPALVLEEVEGGEGVYRRHRVQRDRLGDRRLADNNPFFGDDPGWAFRTYRVHRLALDDERDDPENQPIDGVPIGNAPPQPVTAGKLRQAIERMAELRRQSYDTRANESLYLFNVIVALEWVPTRERMRRLEFTFRRAAEALYDVTNGTMTFGQVIFADASWMECADLQIFASNRLLPRSWVGGLVLPEKYVPIRIGRGIWYNSRQLELEWDEPEGYRTIVHEWCHYALGLKDEYLRSIPVRPTGDGRLERYRPGANGGPNGIVVLPRRRVKSDSIMATAEGSSELDNPLSPEAGAIRDLIEDYYPRLIGSRFGERFSGPGRLPLPLPVFRRVGRLINGDDEERPIALPVVQAAAAPIVEAEAPLAPMLVLDDDDIPPPRWELYVVHPNLDDPQRVIAQGEVDARVLQHGFTLLGAVPGDTIILVEPSTGRTWSRTLGQRTEEKARMDRANELLERLQQDAQRGVARAVGDEGQQIETFATVHAGWTEHRPTARRRAPEHIQPCVVPEPLAEGANPARPRVHLHTDLPREEVEGKLWIVPLGDAPRPVMPDEPLELNSLDGFLLDLSGDSLRLSDFSQGGGPRSSPNVSTNPIAAGAASGDALLFFDGEAADEEQAEAYGRVRVVTNTLREPPLDGIIACSPVFALTANDRLDPKLHPTLMIFNTRDTRDDSQSDDETALRIYRLDPADGEPRPLPTFITAGANSAAAPLCDAEHGGSLVAEEPADGLRLERYFLGRPIAP